MTLSFPRQMTPAMQAAAAAGAAAAMVNLGRPRQPSLQRALQALRADDVSWTGAELERDIAQAAAELYSDGVQPRAIAIPTADSYLRVLAEVGVRTPASEAARYATRAMSEGVGGLNTATIGNTAGAGLVGFDNLVDNFALALTSSVVLRGLPDISVVPVSTATGSLPAETGIATTGAAAENSALSSTDPAISGLAYTLRKIAAYRVLSNELFHDVDNRQVWLQRTLSRDIGLAADVAYLEGSGAGVNVTGVRNYGGLTTSSWVAAANGSTPGSDDLINMLGDIYRANAAPTAFIMAPRTWTNILKLKGSTGTYLFPPDAIFAAPVAPGGYTYPRLAGNLWGVPVYLTTTIPVTETRGSSSVASHIIVGDFSRAVVPYRPVVEVSRLTAADAISLRLSADALFANDQTALLATMRTTLLLTQPLAFSVASGLL